MNTLHIVNQIIKKEASEKKIDFSGAFNIFERAKSLINNLKQLVITDEFRSWLRENDVDFETECIKEFDKFDNGLESFFDLIDEVELARKLSKVKGKI